MDNILEKLCIYDPANPNYTRSDGPMPPPRQKDCYCDNCFYGRDALAMEAIRLKGRIAINVNRITELQATCKTQDKGIRRLKEENKNLRMANIDTNNWFNALNHDFQIALKALDELARLGNGSSYGNSDGNRIAQEAIAKMID